MSSKRIQWSIVIVALILAAGYATWSRAVLQRRAMLPHAVALLELKRLLDTQAHAEADSLLVHRLEVMSERLRGKDVHLPLPPRDARIMADEIDAYLNKPTPCETVEPDGR